MLDLILTQKSTGPGQADYNDFRTMRGKTNLVNPNEAIENEYLHSCNFIKCEGEVVGRYSLYINKALTYNDLQAICIGAYACIDDDYVAEYLLQTATEHCKALGYKFIVGPMNGSTWSKYRFSTDNSEPAFFMDLNNPSYYNDQFIKNDFKSIASYSSGMGQLRVEENKSLSKLETYYASKGASIRTIRLENLKEELYRLADFSNTAFKNNFLFTPIDRDLFVAQYMKLKSLMDKELIWIVEDERKNIHAFFFAYRDPSATDTKTIVMKSAAVLPNSTYKGIATFLFRKLIQAAKTQGYQKIIHAFMHESKSSLRTSKKYTLDYKHYELYGKFIDNKSLQ